ncbi:MULTISPECIES: diacylglycerol kinase family protein [unclassified Devosia]|uniref:diacylglycerol/lipid kinase family protein n=1 Tax=unclassified Devosia TaxID=196773 RepID=UPI0015530F8A|nr:MULTISPECIES: diacylglycerol kinase family protein [unclassified Devosia]
MVERHFHVILNTNAGTAHATGTTGETLAAMFAEAGLEATIDADGDAPFKERIERALQSPADTIVAAGGDGTITALAHALVGTDKNLAILPLGTVNLLARDLHLPLTVPDAVKQLQTAELRRIDVGQINGQTFLHKVVIGTIPGVAAGREHIRGTMSIGTKIAFFRYFTRRLARARRMAVRIVPRSGEARVERVQSIAVSSNAYEEGFGKFFARNRLDRGSLTLYVIKHLNLGDVARLTARMLLGRWRDDEALTIESVDELTIETRKKALKVMLDGEVETFSTPLHFKILPLALSVLAPASPEAPADAPLPLEEGLAP